MARTANHRSVNCVPLPFWRRRWFDVTSRSMASIFGGYALAASSNVFLSLALPMARGQAVIASMLIAIVVAAVAPLWAFATNRAWKAWLGIVAPALVMALLAAVLHGAVE